MSHQNDLQSLEKKVKRYQNRLYHQRCATKRHKAHTKMIQNQRDHLVKLCALKDLEIAALRATIQLDENS